MTTNSVDTSLQEPIGDNKLCRLVLSLLSHTYLTIPFRAGFSVRDTSIAGAAPHDAECTIRGPGTELPSSTSRGLGQKANYT